MIRRQFLFIIGAIAFVLSVAPQHAHAARKADRELGGSVTATVDGRQIHFPALKTDITADIQGDLATVTVVQTFSNPTALPRVLARKELLQTSSANSGERCAGDIRSGFMS